MVADCTLVEAVVVMVLGIHPALVAMLSHSVWVRVILFIMSPGIYSINVTNIPSLKITIENCGWVL